MNGARSSDLTEPAQRATVMTAAQCRSARTLLGWSVAKLAAAASVSETAIDDFELERHPPEPAVAGSIRNALEAVGVEFLSDDDVRLRPGPAVT
jgi:transcriptional regulator with XRE-family HTH domain